MSKQRIISLIGILFLAIMATLLNGNFRNRQKEKAVTDYLLTQNYFSWKTVENSRNFCAIENLNYRNESFPLYVWVLCEEFVMENGELKVASGSSGPAKINYPNQLSYYDLSKFSYEAPGDGSLYAKDIKNIFPLHVQLRIFGHNAESLSQKLEKIARDNFGK